MLKIDEDAAACRLQWCLKKKRYTDKYWEKIVFTDECKVHSSQFRIRFVRRYAGEELGEDYCVKNTKYDGQSGVLVWGAIKHDGPAALKIFDERIDSEVYLDVLKNKVRKIDGLKEGKLKYQHDNWAVHRAGIVRQYLEKQSTGHRTLPI